MCICFEGALYMLPVVMSKHLAKEELSHSNYFQDVRAFHRRTAKRQQWDQIVLLLKGCIKYYNPFMWLSNENRRVSACKAVLELNIVVESEQSKRRAKQQTWPLCRIKTKSYFEIHSIYLWSDFYNTCYSKAALQKTVARKKLSQMFEKMKKYIQPHTIIDSLLLNWILIQRQYNHNPCEMQIFV